MNHPGPPGNGVRSAPVSGSVSQFAPASPANQPQNLDSVSRLAGGVAHDFNNLLTIMSGYANLLLDDDEVTPAVRSKLEEIVKAANRAKELTDKLLMFSRTHPHTASTVGIEPFLAGQSPASPSAPADIAQGLDPRPDVRGGIERILVVEDDDNVRLFTRTALERFGYRVTEAGNPAEAIRIVRDGLRFDLLVTDVVMPGMNGRRMVSEMEQLVSGFEVLYVSGFAETTIGLTSELHADDARFLGKPFAPEALAHKVRRLLDSRH